MELQSSLLFIIISVYCVHVYCVCMSMCSVANSVPEFWVLGIRPVSSGLHQQAVSSKHLYLLSYFAGLCPVIFHF